MSLVCKELAPQADAAPGSYSARRVPQCRACRAGRPRKSQHGVAGGDVLDRQGAASALGVLSLHDDTFGMTSRNEKTTESELSATVAHDGGSIVAAASVERLAGKLAAATPSLFDAEEPTADDTPKAKKAKIELKVDEEGAPMFWDGENLNEKGLDSWLRKCTTDRITGDLWRAKAKHIKPVNLAKEMVAAISDDQERIAAALEKVSELLATKKVMIRSGGRPGQCSYKCSGPIRDRS